MKDTIKIALLAVIAGTLIIQTLSDRGGDQAKPSSSVAAAPAAATPATVADKKTFDPLTPPTPGANLPPPTGPTTNIAFPVMEHNFGKVMQVDGSLDPSDFTAWDDGLAANLPNVRPDTSFERDREDPSLPAFQRRWSVWAPTGLAAQYVKLIGVSVVYREQTFARPMEVTLLVQVGNTGAVLANAAAYR